MTRLNLFLLSFNPQILLLLFLVVTVFYFEIPDTDPYLPFLGVFSLQFLLYMLLVMNAGSPKLQIPVILGTAFFARFILLWSDPVLENDYFRYLWDGRVLAHGLNPYLYSPDAEELNFLTTGYRNLIGWPDIRTIYPPVAQIFFAISHLIAPDSLFVLKLGLIAFEVTAGLLLLKLANSHNEQKLFCLLYFLNPLLLKEIANSAHLDALPMLLSFGAVVAFLKMKNTKKLAWVLLALSVGAKSYSILLVPLFLKLDPERGKNILLFGLSLAVFYIPFLDAGWTLFSGASAFSTYWIFNAGIFKVLTVFLNWLLLLIFPDQAQTQAGTFLLVNDYPAKLFVSMILSFFVLYKTCEIHSEQQLPRISLHILGAIILVSPVVNAWYVLWLFPFACYERSVPWLAFTFLVVAGYSWFWTEQFAYLFRIFEYGVLYILLISQFMLQRDRVRVSVN